MYVGDFTRGTVYSSDNLQFEFGYENDDFTKDLKGPVALVIGG